MNPVNSHPSKPSKIPCNRPLQFKRGSAKAFWKANLILEAGQPAVELDTHKLKIGDGFTKYRQLPYIGDGAIGEDGKSAYQIYQDGGGTMTEEQFITSILTPAHWGTF